MRIVLMLVLLFPAVAQAGSYGRYGVALDVPAVFSALPPPGNDDGRSFSDGQGGQLRVWGGWRTENLALDMAQRCRAYEARGAKITYARDAAGWFVLSGYLGKSIFYLRVEDGVTCGGEDARAHFELLYPAGLRGPYDALAGRLGKSLGFGPC